MNKPSSSIRARAAHALGKALTVSILLAVAPVRAADPMPDGFPPPDSLTAEALFAMLAPTPEEETAINAFFEHYTQSPNSGEAFDLLPTVDAMIRNRPSAAASMTGIYAGIVATSPERADEWHAMLDSNSPPWLKAAIKLGLFDPEARKKVLYPAPEKISASRLEVLWGWYFTTGDAEAPRFIIRCGGEGAFPGSAQAAAAKSAKAQAREHPPVAAELDAYALSATDGELRVFFHDADDVATVRDVLSSAALARLDALFALPEAP